MTSEITTNLGGTSEAGIILSLYKHNSRHLYHLQKRKINIPRLCYILDAYRTTVEEFYSSHKKRICGAQARHTSLLWRRTHHLYADKQRPPWPDSIELLPWHASTSGLVPCRYIAVFTNLQQLENMATDFGILRSRQRLSPLADLVMANDHHNL